MAEPRTKSGLLEIHIAHVFDRLFESKLAQVRLGIQKPVQRLLERRPNHLVQMRLNAPFVDLQHRP